MKKLIFIIAVVVMAGCAGMNDAMTPSAHVQKDDFDGATIITQEPVNASNITDDWHLLGFDWTSRTPDSVYITVGVYGVSNISGVKFNVDGNIIDSTRPASTGTDYANATAGMVMSGTGGDTWSKRRFVMPLPDFRLLAAGSDTRIRVERINKYSVSKIGPSNGNAVVNVKFKPFLEKIAAATQK